MAYNLTLASAGFNTTGKFGQSLNAGKGSVTASPLIDQDVTIEGWFKHDSTLPGTQVCINVGAWIGMVSGGFIRGTVGSVDIVGTTNYADNLWHHVALTYSPATASNLGSKLYVDGVLQGSGAPANPTNYDFSIGGFPATGAYDWVGEIDDVAVTAGIKYTTAFTPPTAAISDSAAGLIAVWHLDGNGLDTKAAASPAAAVTLSLSASSGTVGAPVTITVGTNNPLTGAQSESVAVTSNIAGTFVTSPVTLNASTATATLTYTPSAAGSATITAVATGTPSGLTNGTIGYTATAADTTAPVLTSPTGTQTGANTASGTVTTDEGNGTLYFLATVNATETAATVKAGGTTGGSQAVSSTGSKSVTVASLTASTTYYLHYVHRDAANNDSLAYHSASFTTSAASTATLDPAKMILSPGNWNVGAASLKAVNAGAYFRTIFDGTACTLQFDMTGVTNPSRFYYKIDNGPLTKATVAASVVLTMPTGTTQWAGKGGHTLEFIIQERTNFVEIWTNPAVLVSLSGIVLDAGKSLVLPADVRSLKGLVFGDSITEAQVSVASDGTGDATLSYAYHLRNLMGAEIGVVGFGGQGWGNIGGGNSPTFPNAYNKIYSGVTRSFAGLDFIVINQGQNDSGGDVHVPVTAVLNGILADATLPSTCKIIVMRPFSGSSDSTIIAGIAACSNPARVSHMDTTGFFNTTNSADGVHPYGNEQITHIAPQVAAQIKAILAGGPTLTTRTVTLTLGDTVGASANLTGLSWTWQDTFNGAVLSSGTSGTTNASGVFSASVSTSLASGGTGNLKILGAANAHFNGPCVVA